MKPYKDGVTLKQIIHDGWSRDFEPEQTIREAKEIGFEINKESLLLIWQEYTDKMNEHFAKLYDEAENE